MAAVGISLSSAEYLFFGFTPLINEFISLGAVRTMSWNESLHLKRYMFLKIYWILMNTSLKPWVQYWIYSWLGVPKTAVGGWKCCQRTSGLLRTKHKPEKYRAYAAQVQFLPMPFSVSMWGFLQPQGTPNYHSMQMGLVVPHFKYIWTPPGRAYTFGQSTCETFRQLQLHQIFLLRHSIAWALPGDRFDRQGVLLHGCGTDVPWLVPIKGAH